MMATVLISICRKCGAWRYSHLGIKLGPLDVKTIPTLLTTTIGVGLALCAFLALIAIVLFDH